MQLLAVEDDALGLKVNWSSQLIVKTASVMPIAAAAWLRNFELKEDFLCISNLLIELTEADLKPADFAEAG